MVERRLSGLFQSGKHHTDNPEKDNVISCYKHVCRIEIFQFRRFVRPPQSRERPECGTEPGIQGIFVLMKMGASAFRTFLRHLSGNNHFAALVAVVCGNPVSPPKLTGNTPVTDVFQPVEISFSKALGNKFQFSCVQDFYSCLRHLVHAHEPLRLDHRFYRSSAAVMGSHAVAVRNHFYQKPLRL